MVKLVVIIVSWNTKDLTRKCIHSLLPEIVGIDNEVWVVDNASNDGSFEILEAEFPDLRLLRNKVNVGFARANNQVLRLAKGEYFLLLNTDTIVPPGSVSALLKFMDNNYHIAAVGPMLKNEFGSTEKGQRTLPSLAGELRYCLVSHFPPFGYFFERLFKRRRADSKVPTEPVPSEVLSAACLLLRSEVVEKIGLLSEDYFLFSEENDYFLRMKQAGFIGYYYPGVFIYHLVGKSRSKRSEFDSDKHFLRSRRLFFKKYYKGKFWLFTAIYWPFLFWSLIFYRILAIGLHTKHVTYLKYKMLIRVLTGSLNE